MKGKGSYFTPNSVFCFAEMQACTCRAWWLGWLSVSQLRMSFLSEDVIAVMRMGKSKDSKSFPLTLFNVPYSVSWTAVAFTLSYQTVTAWGHRFCVERAVVCLLLFSHFHIFTLEFQLLVSSCSDMPLGIPWRAFLGTHAPLYALVQCVCSVWTSVEHAPEGQNWPCTDGQLFA